MIIIRGKTGTPRCCWLVPTSNGRALRLGREDAGIGYEESIRFVDGEAINLAIEILDSQPALELADHDRLQAICERVISFGKSTRGALVVIGTGAKLTWPGRS